MDLPSGVVALTDLKRTPGKGSTSKRIFDKKRDDLITALEQSIVEAAGRYEDNNRASYKEGVAVPHGDDGEEMTKITAAPNWRVQLNGKTNAVPYPHPVKVDDKDDREFPAEAVFIHLKAGRTKVPLFAGEDTYLAEKRLSSDDLVRTLEHFKAQVEGWTPDLNETTRIFHMVGVVDSIAPLTRTKMAKGEEFAHCLEQDKIVEKAKVKKESPYSLATVVDNAMDANAMKAALAGGSLI